MCERDAITTGIASAKPSNGQYGARLVLGICEGERLAVRMAAGKKVRVAMMLRLDRRDAPQRK